MYDTGLSAADKAIMGRHGVPEVLNLKGKIRIEHSN